jgi:hypothetical protein
MTFETSLSVRSDDDNKLKAYTILMREPGESTNEKEFAYTNVRGSSSYNYNRASYIKNIQVEHEDEPE